MKTITHKLLLFFRLRNTCIKMLTLSIFSLFMAGCIGIPQNALKQSEMQIKQLEQYRDSVQSIIDNYRKDADALIAERDQDYNLLILRAEDFRKELYRLSSHLLSREKFPEQTHRFQKSLTEDDKKVIQMIEQHIDKQIEIYKKSTSNFFIDANSIIELKDQNKINEIREILDNVLNLSPTVKRDIENLLMKEPFENVRGTLIKLINSINNFLEESNTDIDKIGKELKLLIRKIDDLETAIDDIKNKRAAFHKKAKGVIKHFNEQIKPLESAGQTIIITQSHLHGILCQIKTNEIKPNDILLNVSPVIDSLGTAGVLSKKDTKGINEIMSSLNNIFNSEEK